MVFDVGIATHIAAVVTGGELAVDDGVGGDAAVTGSALLGLPALQGGVVGFLGKDTGGVELIDLGFVDRWLVGHEVARLLGWTLLAIIPSSIQVSIQGRGAWVGPKMGASFTTSPAQAKRWLG